MITSKYLLSSAVFWLCEQQTHYYGYMKCLHVNKSLSHEGEWWKNMEQLSGVLLLRTEVCFGQRRVGERVLCGGSGFGGVESQRSDKCFFRACSLIS